MKLRVEKGKTLQQGKNWYRVVYSLEADVEPQNVHALRRQLENVINQWLSEAK